MSVSVTPTNMDYIKKRMRQWRSCDTLPRDAWKRFDEAIVAVAHRRLVASEDLRSRGLITRLEDPWSQTHVEWQRTGQLTQDPVTAIDPSTPSTEENYDFDQQRLPLPMYRKDFRLGIRQINSAQRAGFDLSTLYAEEATRLIADKIEDSIFDGISFGRVGPDANELKIQGLRNFTGRVTKTITTSWAATAKTGSEMLADLLDMIDRAYKQNMRGPYVLYVSETVNNMLDKDYTVSTSPTNPTISIRQRLLQVEALSAIVGVPTLNDNNNSLILLEPIKQNIELIVGLDPTLITWEAPDGFSIFAAVIAVIVPRIREDMAGQIGIVHTST